MYDITTTSDIQLNCNDASFPTKQALKSGKASPLPLFLYLHLWRVCILNLFGMDYCRHVSKPSKANVASLTPPAQAQVRVNGTIIYARKTLYLQLRITWNFHFYDKLGIQHKVHKQLEWPRHYNTLDIQRQWPLWRAIARTK